MAHPSRQVVDAFVDLRSPYSYLAIGPARAMAERLGVDVAWWPYITDFQGAYGGEVAQRSPRDVAKVKYLYMDCRRLARLQGLTIRSTVKLWDATLGSQAFLFARARDRLWAFADPVLTAFWRREFDLESPAALEAALVAAGLEADDWRAYVRQSAQPAWAQAQAHAEQLGVFGAPTFVYQGELFWGGDRLALLEAALARAPAASDGVGAS